jgi:hypothetical protein
MIKKRREIMITTTVKLESENGHVEKSLSPTNGSSTILPLWVVNRILRVKRVMIKR